MYNDVLRGTTQRNYSCTTAPSLPWSANLWLDRLRPRLHALVSDSNYGRPSPLPYLTPRLQESENIMGSLILGSLVDFDPTTWRYSQVCLCPCLETLPCASSPIRVVSLCFAPALLRKRFEMLFHVASHNVHVRVCFTLLRTGFFGTTSTTTSRRIAQCLPRKQKRYRAGPTQHAHARSYRENTSVPHFFLISVLDMRPWVLFSCRARLLKMLAH